MIIQKFGGTSVGSPKSAERIIQILNKSINDKNLLVLSALSGVTDLLCDVAEIAARGNNNDVNNIVEEIKKRHIAFIEDNIKASEDIAKDRINTITKELSTFLEGISLLRELTPKSFDKAVSFGELLSTTVYYFLIKDAGFSVDWLDARKIIKTNSEHGKAKINLKMCIENIKIISQSAEKHNIIITQGFIASDKQNNTTTLGRGGSDYSASIFAKLVKASEIRIWTDVSGIMTADPRIIKSATALEKISFSEMSAMAFFGAKVLHPDTLEPAMENNIPVKILNTFTPDGKGTTVTNKASEETLPKSLLAAESIKLSFFMENQVESSQHTIDILEITRDSGIKIYHLQMDNISSIFYIENTPLSQKIAQNIEDKYKCIKEEVYLLCLFGSKIDLNHSLYMNLANDLKNKGLVKINYSSAGNYIIFEIVDKIKEQMLKYIHNNYILKSY